jgi:HSP20 family protein
MDRNAEKDRQSTNTQTPSTPARAQQTRWVAPRSVSSPFGSLFDRWNQEMDRLFSDAGFGGAAPRGAWAPQIEVFQRGNDLVVRADLPGLQKDDIRVDVKDNILSIEGERRQENEEEHEGWYRNERSYGSFCRTVALPEGAIADSARATFKNGVLEVILQAPPKEAQRGRQISID